MAENPSNQTVVGQQFPQPKYRIGDKVWSASYELQAYTEPCPDCQGSRFVTVTAAGGDTWEQACSLCMSGYFSSGCLQKYRYTPLVKQLTIGSIRIDTEDRESVVSYMCKETGIGSGQIHRELDLYDNETAAFEIAKMQVRQRQIKDEENRVKQKAERRRQGQRKPDYKERKIHQLEKEVKRLQKLVPQEGVTA